MFAAGRCLLPFLTKEERRFGYAGSGGTLSLSSNLSQVGDFTVDGKVGATESDVAIDNRRRSAKHANGRDPVVPVTGSCEIVELFARAPALRPPLIIRPIENADAVVDLLVR